MKKLLFLSICLFCFGFISKSYAQIFYFKNKIKVDFKESSIKLNQADTTISITYDLKAAPNRYYKARLFYSNNKGNSFKGPLFSVKGDIGDSIKPGKNKQASWSFKKDNPYFDGKNIMFKLDITEIPKISTGGPKYALRSLLVPGWGDTKVRNGYNYGVITIATYGCLITGAIFQLEANRRYNRYTDRLANSSAEHESLYKQAQNSKNLATAFFATGAGIWIADVVGVYIRGVKNRRRVAAEKRKLEEEKGNETTLKVFPLIDGQSTQMGLSFKF
ncbi:MAG: hypothetical protein EAZ85_07805 [Bacteroidetes bacterium]|nr:MAG: hypothetical protein EAZ85_07805 [Bacteroidota bacterium]TAG92758.1 MAG: hypothetical protein EAZ20_02270 [Bacteroidota bacterium]